MSPLAAWILCALTAYLLGAVPFGLLMGKLMGVDIREHGSGNTGATNTLRVLGKRAGAAVLLLDAGKGALPVLALPALLVALEISAPAWLPVLLAGLAVFGHVFPVYLRFQGGKGVATSAGAFAALHPPAFLAALTTFLLLLAVFRIVSLGSVLSAVALPLASILLVGPTAAFDADLPRTALFLTVAALVIARHRANIGRLLAGTEPRIGESKPAETTPEPGQQPSPTP